MRLQTIIENEYNNLENDRPSRPDFLPHDRTLQKIVRDLKILSKEAEELQIQWNRQRAASIVRVLRSNATLLDMLVESDL